MGRGILVLKVGERRLTRLKLQTLQADGVFGEVDSR